MRGCNHLLKIAWIIAVVLFPECVMANGPTGLYYSVYTNAFRNHADAGNRVRYLRRKGNPAFLRSIKVPGEMATFKVYVGKYAGEKEALDRWEQLKRQNLVNHFSIHLIREPANENRDRQTVKQRAERTGKVHSALSTAKGSTRFIDNGDGTVTDRFTRLMWVKNGWRPEFRSALTWGDAVRKTGRLKVAGHENWRLPTMDEWNSLLDSGRQFPALVEPNPFTNMISHMPYWSNTEYAYGMDFTCKTICPVEAYSVRLYSGTIIHQNKQNRAFVMPVRALGMPPETAGEGQASLEVQQPNNPNRAGKL